MELNSVVTFVNSIKNNGQFGAKAITITTPSWRATTNNPYVGIVKEGRKVVERIERVQKVTIYNNDIMIGGNYVSQVATRIEKVGGDKTEWETAPMKGTEWEQFPYLMHSTKDNEQKYLRITLRKNCKPITLFFLDGRLVEDEDVKADIKSWLKPTYISAKQAEMGIADENMVRPLNIKIEGLVMLQQGDIKATDEDLLTSIRTEILANKMVEC